MNVLYISSKPAYPKIDGGCVASANFLNNLVKVVSQVKYLAIETAKHPFKLDLFPEELANKVQPEAIFIETAVRPLEALKYLFYKKSYNIDRFYNDSFKNKIEHTLNSEAFDVIVLDGLFSTPYLDSIKAMFSGPLLVRTHNVEYQIWEGLSKNERNPIKKRYFKKLAKDLKKYEIQTLNKADGIMTLSHDDLKEFNKIGVSTPKAMITISTDVVDVDHDYTKNDLFHLGSMNWQPNIEAVNIVTELMSEIRSKNENLEFHIAGIESENSNNNDPNNGIIVDGYVDDLKQFVSEMGILVTPIQSGSGIRVKILEMMAFGIPVITSELGAHGLLETDAVRIANCKEDVVKAIYELANNENKRRELGLKAKRYVTLHHNPEKVSEQIIEFIKSI